jgi:predicted metal-dependent hydrolase
MDDSDVEYDPRYLGGILFFNERDFFEAHEVWEDLWMNATGQERKFIQGLIQAAVALFHFGNGNLRGALKLYRSSFDYMKDSRPRFLGLDVVAFWQAMDHCFAEALAQAEPDRSLRPREEMIPVISLDPAPISWPDLTQFDTDQD